MTSDVITQKEISDIEHMFKRVILGSKLHFLIVDDSSVSRTMVERVIRSLNYTSITTAKNGLDAMTKLPTLPDPLIIVLDVNMPIMDGITFLGNIQSELKDRKILVFNMSANKSRETVLRCIKLGAKGYICKPFSPAQIESKINDALNIL